MAFARPIPFSSLILLGFLVAACGGREPPDERPSRIIEFVTPENCDVLPTDPRTMAGAYLREIEGPGIFEALVIRGIEGRNALPPEPRIDERQVRERPRGEIGSFVNTRPGTADPIAALTGPGNVRGYTLAYAGDDLGYTGTAVVAEVPAGAELPNAGQVRLSGPADLILRAADGADVPLSGRIDALIGYGSGTAVVQLSQVAAADGRDLPFATVVWSGLGLCGTRIVSTGQGSVRVTDTEGRIVTPFGRDGAPTAAISTLNGFLTAGIDVPSGPVGAGGVVLIQGDGASLRGGFALGDGN